MKKQQRRPPIPALTLSKGMRVYLYATAGITGAAIMIVEILGAKMLSPYLGMSHFVWTAQIAVTLMALACGYYIGGRLADQSQQLRRLYWAILAAAVYLAATVVVCEPLAYWCLDFNLAFGALLASGILFFVPLALLAMTGPFLAPMITSSISTVGGNVGRLTSIGTLGSLAGTALIGYLLIPLLPNSITMYVTALTLMAVSIGYLTVVRRKAVPALSFVIALGVGLSLHGGAGPKGLHGNVVEDFRGNSHFGQLRVVTERKRPRRYLLNDNLIQGEYDLVRKQSSAAFIFILEELARAYTTELNDVLCIGLGVGLVPQDLARQGVHVDAVEINPAVVGIAERFFDFEPQRVRVAIDDGRHFLNRSRKTYDVVVLDAFLGDSSPSHLMTREAFGSIARVLRPGGVLLIHVFGSLVPGRDFFPASLQQTLRDVFAGVRLHSSGDESFYFVATDHRNPEFVHLPNSAGAHPEARAGTEVAIAQRVEVPPDHGRVLTDDYNPVEFYDARNREGFRRMMAIWAKDM